MNKRFRLNLVRMFGLAGLGLVLGVQQSKGKCGSIPHSAINERFFSCDLPDGTSFSDDRRLAQLLLPCWQRISDVCSNGCYMHDTPECRERYWQAMSPCVAEMTNLAYELNCADAWEGVDSRKVIPMNRSCKSTQVQPMAMHCGGVKGQPTCGQAKQEMCLSEIACSSRFVVEGKTVDPGIYQVLCLVPLGQCDHKQLDISKCAADPNLSVPHYPGIFPPEGLWPIIQESREQKMDWRRRQGNSPKGL